MYPDQYSYPGSLALFANALPIKQPHYVAANIIFNHDNYLVMTPGQLIETARYAYARFGTARTMLLKNRANLNRKT